MSLIPAALTLDTVVSGLAGAGILFTIEHGWGAVLAIKTKLTAKAKAETDAAYSKIKSQVDVAVAAKLTDLPATVDAAVNAKLADIPTALDALKGIGPRVDAAEKMIAALVAKVGGV
jgi:hypothetical protein